MPNSSRCAAARPWPGGWWAEARPSKAIARSAGGWPGARGAAGQPLSVHPHARGESTPLNFLISNGKNGVEKSTDKTDQFPGRSRLLVLGAVRVKTDQLHTIEIGRHAWQDLHNGQERAFNSDNFGAAGSGALPWINEQCCRLSPLQVTRQTQPGNDSN